MSNASSEIETMKCLTHGATVNVIKNKTCHCDFCQIEIEVSENINPIFSVLNTKEETLNICTECLKFVYETTTTA